jgi:aspartate dehydrogenase
VLLGLGAINGRVASLLRLRASAVDIVGVIVRTPRSLSQDAAAGAAVITSAADLAALSADVIVEAASPEAVRDWGAAALQSARRVIVSSASAFTDDGLLQNLRDTALRCGSQLVLSHGALAGVDALSAAGRLQMNQVSHRIIKSPRSWGAAAGEYATLTARSPPVVLFQGPAREAASRFPLNANVTAVSALASIGLDKVIVELICDPSATTNRHEIRASGDFGCLTVTLENRPLRSNPKSSELAALALVRLVENEGAGFIV